MSEQPKEVDKVSSATDQASVVPIVLSPAASPATNVISYGVEPGLLNTPANQLLKDEPALSSIDVKKLTSLDQGKEEEKQKQTIFGGSFILTNICLVSLFIFIF